MAETEIDARTAERDAWQNGLEVVELMQADIDALPEYSTTLPTGKTIGKRWKRRLFAGPKRGAWLLCEYVEDPDPAYLGIRTREIVAAPVPHPAAADPSEGVVGVGEHINLAVEALLAEHGSFGAHGGLHSDDWQCACGFVFTAPGGGPQGKEGHRTHLASILAEHTERAVREALEAAAVRVEAEVDSEIERLGGKAHVSANGMLNNWVGGIATAARIVREGGRP